MCAAGRRGAGAPPAEARLYRRSGNARTPRNERLGVDLVKAAIQPMRARWRRSRDDFDRAPDRSDASRARDIVGASAPMREVFETVARVARTRSTVLIQGETGTG